MTSRPAGWWLEALFDLLANERVKVEFESKLGGVDALLSVRVGREYVIVADVIAADTLAEAMTVLLEDYERWKAAD
jgi:hypothetical protein